MVGPPPPECQPLHPYKWIRTDSLLMLIIMQTLPWINWPFSKEVIVAEIKTNTLVQYSFAKTGFWIKYFVITSGRKIPVEVFILTVHPAQAA